MFGWTDLPFEILSYFTLQTTAKTLIDVLDHTISPMGSGKDGIPLKEKSQIDKRLSIVEHIIKEKNFQEVIEEKSKIGDLERLISKVSTTRISPRECNQLKLSLQSISPIKEICINSSNKQLQIIGKKLNPCKKITEKIESTISENPPGKCIREGVSELDELRNLSKSKRLSPKNT